MRRLRLTMIALLGSWTAAGGGLAAAPVDAPSAPVEEALPEVDPLTSIVPEAMPEVRSGDEGDAVIRLQVLLDRARFSPGVIDGIYGKNTGKAVVAFQEDAAVEADGVVDAETWRLLLQDRAPVLTRYTIAPEDVEGPFTPIPADMMEQSELESLGYTSPLEKLAERFHAHPSLLKDLNPGVDFARAGTVIVVPAVERGDPPGEVARIVVDESDGALTALDAEGEVLAHYPATTGSEANPLPYGTWKVRAIAQDPVYHYDPETFDITDPEHAKARIAPGPNNPVGTVWIDLTREHYGIHGTPEPALIGYTHSHGCIRLTNWDAEDLASMVEPGVEVEIRR